MPIDGPAPAVVNALRHAGVVICGDSGDAGEDHAGVSCEAAKRLERLVEAVFSSPGNLCV